MRTLADMFGLRYGLILFPTIVFHIWHVRSVMFFYRLSSAVKSMSWLVDTFPIFISFAFINWFGIELLEPGSVIMCITVVARFPSTEKCFDSGLVSLWETRLLVTGVTADPTWVFVGKHWDGWFLFFFLFLRFILNP